MTLNSVFYRQREAIERDRASSAGLENVKTVATRAAGAWALAASRAERLESANARRLTSPPSAEDAFADPSENPDRGHAT